MEKIISLIILLIILILPNQNLFSQEYIELMDDPKINFYEVQKKFYEYWNGRNYERGKGWKQFKRWEEFMEPRTFPTGERFDASIAFREYQNYMESYLNADNPVFGDWTPLGPTTWTNGNEGYNPGNGRINCVIVDPHNANDIYVGAPAGGLWKTTNNGINWTVLTDHLAVLGVSSIVIHPGNSDVIYIATGDGDGGQTYSIGVLKSIDRGITWTPTGLSYNVLDFVRINKLIMHPTNPNIIIAASNQGIHKTTNAGVNWTQTVSGSNMRDIEFKPNSPLTIYSAGTTFRKSTDGGDNFVTITSGLPASGIQRIAIGVSPANNEYVYLLASRSSNGGFLGYYRSTNGGNDFITMSTSPNLLGYEISGSDAGGQGSYDLATAVSPTDINTVYTGGINLWKSTNGGANFTITSHWYYPNKIAGYPYVHADQHFLDYYGSKLFAGCDGGIFVTTNGGTNFTDLSAGLNIMQFYKFGGTPQSASRIIGGTQDNGSNLFNGAIWTHLFGADGGEAIIDYTDSNTLYCEYQGGGILKSTNGGENFSEATSGISENGAFVTPYSIHPTNPQILFAGFQNVWKTTNGALSWSSISTLGGGTLNALAVSQSNPNYIYTSKSNIIYLTTNGGINWTNISAGLSGLSLTYIAIHPTNPNRVWVTNSGYTAGQKIFTTTNAGVNWANITGSLPNLPANCVTYENGPKEGVYVGMDVGVYYINNQLSGWIPFADQLPNVIVREIEIHYPSSKVRAATLGRGIWQATLASIIVGVQTVSTNVPNNFNLKQNYPNPFNPETQIQFNLPKEGFVTLKVYDGLGKEVAELFKGNKNAGSYEVNFDGSDFSSGTYFYRIEVENNGSVTYAMTRKMVLLK